MKLNLLRKRMKVARKRDSDVLQFLKRFDEVQKRTAKSKLVLPLVLTILFLSTSLHAETLVQLRNRVDTFLTNKVGGANGLIARQNTYATNHNGRFWQGLLTHSSIPSHVTATPGDVTADKLTFTPTDQAESWLDILPEWEPEAFAAAAQVNTYNGPLGRGWVLIVYVRFNSVTYVRAKGFGPETNHDHDWRVWDPTAQ